MPGNLLGFFFRCAADSAPLVPLMESTEYDGVAAATAHRVSAATAPLVAAGAVPLRRSTRLSKPHDCTSTTLFSSFFNNS